MNIADYLIVIIVVIWCLLSYRKGFVREAISLVSWVAAFVVGRIFSKPFTVVLADYVEPASIREPVAFGLLFLATLVVCSLVSRILRDVIAATGLSVVDRVLGMAFGGLKALIMIIFVLGLLSRLLNVQQDTWWIESSLISHLMLFEEWTRNLASQIWQTILAIE